ncbi:type II secretion system F family protein [Paraferrimonas sedimenticola]|uniref:Type II secretion system protein F n=1 Tax=Paraferrimonas sedimenticola TaxID=375674 RepID=A0AA37W1J4_9GAMM|nr:type II secretion system F family protein [Paraferrimonas sedimenticola]GLP97465.1 type II secretion system protein F [Paraferrimonas sedimenticola]
MATASAKTKSKALPVQTFVWKGLNRNGQKASGEIKGTSATEVRTILKGQGISPKSVQKKSKPLFSLGGQKIVPMDIAMLTRQVATMLSAGVPLVTAIELLAKSHEKEPMRNLLNTILADLQSGIPFYECLKPHRKYFDGLYVDLVKAGEASGSLDIVFDRIALYREKAEALKSKIKKALFYPAAVTLVAVVVTAILLVKVVPQFQSIFEGFGAELPAFTQLLITASDFMQAYWFIMLASAAGAGFAFKKAHERSQNVRDRTDAILLKAPVFGDILHKAAIARFSRTLATTFAAGVPLIDGMESAAGASGNAVYRDAIMNVRNEVMAGMQLNAAMHTVNLFPEMLIQMVQIGEEAGSLDDMLNKVASIYEMQVDDAVDGLSSLIEPIMMVVIGTIVGGLIVGMYLPIFQMGDVIG